MLSWAWLLDLACVPGCLLACLFAWLLASACLCLLLLASACFTCYCSCFVFAFACFACILACLPACLLACWQNQDEAEFKMNCAFRFACYPGLQAEGGHTNHFFGDIFRVGFQRVAWRSFLCFVLFLGGSGWLFFAHVSEKYSFLSESADPRFLHTVQRFGLIFKVGRLLK